MRPGAGANNGRENGTDAIRSIAEFYYFAYMVQYLKNTNLQLRSYAVMLFRLRPRLRNIVLDFCILFSVTVQYIINSIKFVTE
jgi:hypothetical protein